MGITFLSALLEPVVDVVVVVVDDVVVDVRSGTSHLIVWPFSRQCWKLVTDDWQN